MKDSILKILYLGWAFLLAACSSTTTSDDQTGTSPVDWVNPYMGNISHLLVPTYPTIHLPNSMLRVYPERGDYTSPLINGLPLITTSHRGSSAFNLSPFQGPETDLHHVIRYSYDQEKITPYSYQVYLDEQQISVDYGLSHQAAIYDINFDKTDAPYLIVNSRNGALQWDGTALKGYQQLANNTRVYLYLKPAQAPTNVQVNQEGLHDATEAAGKNAYLVLKYPANTQNIQLRYGISFIDEAQAQSNLEREVASETVASLQKKGRTIWNEALGKLAVKGGTDNDRTVFYTSLYRCYERPVCISEAGRYYSAFDGQVHEDNGRPFYTDDWIWDSYRAHHPLRALLDPTKEEDILNSFVRMADQMDHFWMPTFPEITGDSRRMNSNHGVAAVIDAYRKGFTNFDLEKAYEACKNGITEKTLAPWSGKPAGGLDAFYKEHGYIPALKDGEKETYPEVNSGEKRQPVAVTLGTSYDEWCLAQIAKELGKTEDYEYFIKQSHNYRNLFNIETKFFHPKDEDGNFIEPFDYVFSGGMGARDYYDENNGWTYRWDVQHNIPDLIDMMGGNDQFIHHLDDMFTQSLRRSKYGFYAQLPDQTGNIGQFTMANEPSLHIPYLYDIAGAPWKTQKLIHKLVHTWFRNDVMGVPGDEDGGGMSSFVVFSQLGFYPFTPGLPVYYIGSPFFEESVLTLPNGKTFKVVAKNYSSQNKYIQSATLNGEPWQKPWFSHEDLAEGGTLELTMGDKANRTWGLETPAAPGMGQ